MRIVRAAVPAVLAVALVIAAVGWFRAEQDRLSPGRFESCTVHEDVLTLSFSYGANSVVAPTIDTTGRDVVVSLNTRRGDGSTPAIALGGEATFRLFGEPRIIRYPDGTELDCGS